MAAYSIHGFDFSKTAPSHYQDWMLKILDSVPAALLCLPIQWVTVETPGEENIRETNAGQ